MSEERELSARYALGHASDELARLEVQARIVDPITRRFWVSAGIRPGMRVLDIGSGAGHTTLLLADLVGQQGRVVGIDNAATAVAAARERSRGVDHVSYVHGDPEDLTGTVGGEASSGGSFDAVVGRYVLMFQPDPAAFLSAVARHAHPGGLVAFHELDAHGVASRPAVPTFEQVTRWNTEATRRYGADPHAGSRLFATFVTAGLPPPTVLAEAIHGRGAGAVDVLTQVRNLARSLLGEMERHQIATAAEVGIQTLLERMLAEATTTDSTVVGHLQVGAYCAV